jgi:hypothetical protein
MCIPLQHPRCYNVRMGKLTPRERAAIAKRMKEIKAKLANPRLTIEEVDELCKERRLLEKQLMNDRNEN